MPVRSEFATDTSDGKNLHCNEFSPSTSRNFSYGRERFAPPPLLMNSVAMATTPHAAAFSLYSLTQAHDGIFPSGFTNPAVIGAQVFIS